MISKYLVEILLQRGGKREFQTKRRYIVHTQHRMGKVSRGNLRIFTCDKRTILLAHANMGHRTHDNTKQ